MNTNDVTSVSRESPFTPGNPAPIELFVGRIKEIEEIQKYATQASTGRLESLFLLGERGIGKTSIASFTRYLVGVKNNMLGIHVFLGRTSNVEDMVRQTLEELLKESKSQKWYNNIAELFGKHIEQVGLFDISIKFSPPSKELGQLTSDFPETLSKFLEKLGDEKTGLFIALDDIDGLLINSDFANWFKSFVDKIATSRMRLPVCIMLIGLPEQRDALAELQPSLMRIFRIIEINRLSDKDVETFLINAFTKVNIKVTKEALRGMVQFSSGLPVIMHEVGDAIFWLDKDGEIDKDDMYSGIWTAAENICKKYLTPKVYQALRSERYRTILNKLGEREHWLDRRFRKKDLELLLNSEEKRVFGNFLRKMRELGVIEHDRDKGRGDYIFTNVIYPVCIRGKSHSY